MTTPKGNRPRRGYSPLLAQNSEFGDPRDRQNSSAGVESGEIATPLAKDSQGRVTVKLEGALHPTTTGGVEVKVDHGLAIQTGSPKRIVARTSNTVVVGADGNLHAKLTAAQIQGLKEYVLAIVKATAQDISYAEPLVADSYTDPEAPLIYNEDGTDVLVSEVLH